MSIFDEVQKKCDEIVDGLGIAKIARTREKLTHNYRNGGSGEVLIDDKSMSKTYAVLRMPATYSVTRSLLNDLISQGLLKTNKISSIFDLGSGTGAGYFALKEIFPSQNIELFERDHNMIDVFDFLTDSKISVNKCDIVSDEINGKADFVLLSYVLNELKESLQEKFFEKLANLSNEYFLIIDAGTERNYKNLMKLKESAPKYGFNVVAPCMCDKCPLKPGDYCDFYVRVQRSSAMRKAKNASESYEDERFIYLLLSKTSEKPEGKLRIIRRPLIMKGYVEFVCCDANGIVTRKIAKSEKETYKQAKKSKINDIL